jgi:hypothetical protein
MCGAELSRGTSASRDDETKAIRCLTCMSVRELAGEERAGETGSAHTFAVPRDLFDLAPEELAVPSEATAPEHPVGDPESVEQAEAIDRGTAGGSAAREWRKRHDRREKEIRDRYGRLGGIVLAFTDDPQSTRAWGDGSSGEAALGKQLDRLREEGMAVLHDRRIPGSRANIDHLVVAPWGVFVVDAKNYTGRVHRRDRGSFFAHDYRLYVGRNDQTKLIDGLTKQVEAVRAAVGEEFAHVPVCKALCFVSGDFELFGDSIEIGGAHVVSPRALGKLIRTAGSLDRQSIDRIERLLAHELPAA